MSSAGLSYSYGRSIRFMCWMGRLTSEGQRLRVEAPPSIEASELSGRDDQALGGEFLNLDTSRGELQFQSFFQY